MWGARPAIWFQGSRECLRAPTESELQEMAESANEDCNALLRAFGYHDRDLARLDATRRKEAIRKSFARYGIQIRKRYDWRLLYAQNPTPPAAA
jgi:hypothetical protein